MNEEPKQIGTSLLSIEANVLIAGFEFFAGLWILYATAQEQWVPASFGLGWSTAENTVYAVYALLAVVIAGFTVEGVAGILEDKVVSRWSCYANTKRKGTFTSEAYKNFSRRRLRILVARNTACCFVLLTIGLVGTFVAKCNFLAVALTLLVGFLASVLFGYLWIDARKGLKSEFMSTGNSER